MCKTYHDDPVKRRENKNKKYERAVPYRKMTPHKKTTKHNWLNKEEEF